MSDNEREYKQGIDDRKRYFELLNQSKEPLDKGDLVEAYKLLKEAVTYGDATIPTWSDTKQAVLKLQEILPSLSQKK